MTAAQLITIFLVMLAERWKYVWGSAKKGVVDCSGAFVYAFKQYGLSIYHGSNTIYRQYLTVKGKIGEIELVPGMAVFKWREEGEPDKYIADGLDDFYHIGLYIGNCRVLEARGTKAGFVESKLTDGWQYAGRLKGVDYSGIAGGDSMAVLWTGTVWDGRLALRSTPERADNIMGWMPNEAQVSVVAEGLGADKDWVQVTYNGQQGYCMTAYLKRAGSTTRTITLSETAAQELLAALQAQG